MPAATRRRQRSSPDIWPGFVDAMATLLIIVIFLLMVFTLAQHFLSEILSGRNEALDRLNRQVSELADMLSLERGANTALRRDLSQVSQELQSSIAARDRISSQLADLLPEREALKAALAESVAGYDLLVPERDALKAALAASAAESKRLLEELTLREAERDKLDAGLVKMRDAAKQASEKSAAEIAAMRDAATRGQEKSAAELAASRTRTDKVDRALVDANKVIAADREKIELQLRTLESLRRDIAALGKVRTELEKKVIDLASALETRGRELTASRERSDELTAELTAGSDRTKILEAGLITAQERTKVLEARLTEARDRNRVLEAELTAAGNRGKALDSQLTALRDRSKALDSRVTALRDSSKALDSRLTAVRDRTKVLEARLSTEQERTALSQREVAKRDVRLAELAGRARKAETDLTEEQKLSASARAQLALLNRQISALRQQLARLATALEASEVKSRTQNVEIVNLGSRLNAALAAKVEELSRYRSEFFGRLREVLGDEQDIRIVGDRFVFQSEVLFESGSADLAAGGRNQIARLAGTLKDIVKRIPTDLDWVLRVDGHTDRIPINTARFPSNWELSTGRAIAVVKQLVALGIPSNRLAATGFADHQPIDSGTSIEAYRRNRRIEFKLTGR